MFSSFTSLFGGDNAFPFHIGPICISASTSDSLFWTLKDGRSKTDNKLVSIFVFEKKHATEQEIAAAQHCVKKLRTMRHPNVVTFINTMENENVIYLVTEPVVPLHEFLISDTEKNPLSVSWGLFQILSVIAFLSESNIVHRSVCMNSVYVTTDGDWKLFGFERIAPFGTAIKDLVRVLLCSLCKCEMRMRMFSAHVVFPLCFVSSASSSPAAVRVS
eukprot:m.86723 g.86723  ORF g.86723 m.86723 type:complete len:217 (+) comp12222_c0_seq2:24-674(+)